MSTSVATGIQREPAAAPAAPGAARTTTAAGAARDREGALWVEVEQAQPMPLHGAFACPPGEVVALVGPSGAGKTSMLRCMAGLMRPARGRIVVAGQVWLDTEAGVCWPPQRRHVGLVFQNYALMPHLSARDNVALALLHLPRHERQRRAAQWLDRVRLSPDQQTRRPAALSGGQQQRVALARALAREPALLLLDEPFSAVDQMTRQGLYDLLAELRQSLHIPIVLVTHDLHEARQLADRLVVMDAGVVLQQGRPDQIYRSPRNARVADLLGIQNRFAGRWLGPLDDADRAAGAGWLAWLTPDGQPTALRLRVRDKGKLSPGQAVTWVIQGDALHLGEEAAGAVGSGLCAVTLPTQVVGLRHLGETSFVELAVAGLDGVKLRVVRSGPQRQRLTPGQSVPVRLDCAWVHVMPMKTAHGAPADAAATARAPAAAAASPPIDR
ncbi:Sulfate/thiosulfate import ATP-binding protein CysA [Tepidimonas charontis]|uniref:Sulfate/thiosulfate import ATP-binding protein CysA n=1 Tax=Tepidimonas charontis TaxID=2267262 RepID=A0A554XHH6_9BURK|nr:Sulfate/thiosulfate import ATP-binding protein CysA [Tepidimonas charontis]